MNKIPLLIIGTGGHCLSIIDVIKNDEKYQLKGLISKDIKASLSTNSYPILGTDEDLQKFNKAGFAFVIGIGQIHSHITRKFIFDKLVEVNAILPSIFSKFSIISDQTNFGLGNVVLHDVVINTNVKVGDNCIINTKVLLEHDVVIGSNTHISTGALINGNVRIGDNCFIGSGSVISNNIRICDNVIIGAGSVVIKSIVEPGVFFGNPAKKKN